MTGLVNTIQPLTGRCVFTGLLCTVLWLWPGISLPRSVELPADAEHINELARQVLSAHRVTVIDAADTGHFFLVTGRQENGSHVTLTLRSLTAAEPADAADEAAEVLRTQLFIATDSPADADLEAALLRGIINSLKPEA